MNITTQILSSLAIISVAIVALVAAMKGFSALPFARRFSPTAPRMKLLESLPLGPRQKVLLITVDDQTVLLGITPHHITSLSLTTAPRTASRRDDTATEFEIPDFSHLLQRNIRQGEKQEAM